MYRMQNRMDLMYLVKNFPALNHTVVCACFELLLLFEISLQLQDGSTTNLISFFPNWLRNSLKKGLFKVNSYNTKCILILIVHSIILEVLYHTLCMLHYVSGASTLCRESLHYNDIINAKYTAMIEQL